MAPALLAQASDVLAAYGLLSHDTALGVRLRPRGVEAVPRHARRLASELVAPCAGIGEAERGLAGRGEAEGGFAGPGPASEDLGAEGGLKGVGVIERFAGEGKGRGEFREDSDVICENS